ncbi:RsmB/NOP family class I SAM-dependent RNA methyltransferase [Rhodocaloribacter litoris]|uniref:RsmB/NOP family class I SAM-dependent RNA methyltransferase n=1 Tax=Rhodocaloribacter litoris TaxID=2558931 RepID=UPI0014219FD3|nr:RsmB/NOP family class I SAM-dependent RNA methyltransferase [Rhodocaloribacter litoris]QXD15271.1 RsmB/NOP family class I SAM-dependent RNA methyltransferase [Rhodocaloribacter litoris]GIV62272.1 MAG: hypothetical protein KatS3mg044_1138 [Rhodothermaceae bacterium]
MIEANRTQDLPVFTPFERYRPIVDDWDAFIEALARPLPTCVWTNTLRTDPHRVEAQLRAAGFPVTPLRWRPGAFRLPPDADPANLPGYLAGFFHIQEEASMLPVRLLDPRPGGRDPRPMRLLDLCAAPGNKTAEMAVALRNGGTIVANDVSRSRLNVLRTTLDRLGLLNVSVTRCDAAGFPLEAGPFDGILCDVPCSCEGTVRRHPGVVGQSGPAFSARMHRRQRRILARAVRLLRPGGRLVYATCTFAPEENELVVAHVLRHFGDELTVCPITLEGLHTTPGLTCWNGQSLPASLRHTRRLWPHHNDTGGFFVALLEKKDLSGRQAIRPVPTGMIPNPDEAPPELAFLHERFGFPEDLFAAYAFHRPNKKYLAITSRDHDPPERPAPQHRGLFLLKTSLRHPKLTTGAAQVFGPHATRNVVHLNRADLTAYLNRETIRLPREALEPGVHAPGCTGFGYVLVRHEDMTFGLALLKPDDEGAWLKSLFPKTWAGIRAPFGPFS